MDDLAKFAKIENKRQEKLYKINGERAVLAQTVKLGEEVGELNEQILHTLSLQRKAKGGSDQDKLSEEFADVVLVCFLIADRLKVDMKAALEKKMKKIEKRYE